MIYQKWNALKCCLPRVLEKQIWNIEEKILVIQKLNVSRNWIFIDV